MEKENKIQKELPDDDGFEPQEGTEDISFITFTNKQIKKKEEQKNILKKKIKFLE